MKTLNVDAENEANIRLIAPKLREYAKVLREDTGMFATIGEVIEALLDPELTWTESCYAAKHVLDKEIVDFEKRR